MFLDEVHYSIFYNMLEEKNIKLVGIIEKDCVISRMFMASVNKALNEIKERIKIDFMEQKNDTFGTKYDLVFPRLLIFKNNKLIDTIYGFKNSKKLINEIKRKIK